MSINNKLFALVAAFMFVSVGCVRSYDDAGFHKPGTGGAGGNEPSECDVDGDGYYATDCVDGAGHHGTDCNDNNAEVYPGHGCGGGTGGNGTGGDGTGGSGNAPPTGDMVTYCYRYTAPQGYDLTWGEVHFWTLQQPDGDYTDLNKEVGGDPNNRAAVAQYEDGEEVEFSYTIVKADSSVYYPFDVCDYPGAYCEGNAGCVPAVGHAWVTKGNCEAQNPPVVWDSNTATFANGGKVDNPDGLGNCSPNGKYKVKK